MADFNFSQSDLDAIKWAQDPANWGAQTYSGPGSPGYVAPGTQPAAPAPSGSGQVSTQVQPNSAFSGLRNLGAAVQYDSQGRPIRNDYLSTTDANGNLLSQFQLANRIGPDVQLDKTALNQIQNRATSTGPSAWAQLAQQQLQMNQNNAINQANRQAQFGFNQGYANLAGRGGISSGQRERMAQMASRNAFSGAQGIRNQGMQGALNIGLQDQQQKDQMLMQLPGMQQNASAFDQAQRAYRNSAMATDVGRGLQDVQGFNAYNSDAYKKAMEEWGAGKTADAQAQAARSSSGGGGLLSNILGGIGGGLF